jgi:hypothetical protein
MKKLRVQVTAYKGRYIIETLDPKEKKNVFYPVGGTRIGSVLCNTKKHLGISKEALKLLKELTNVRDDIGDVDSFETETMKGKKTGEHVFAWLGDLNIIRDTTAVGSRTFNASALPHVVIPNKVPAWAKKQIDAEG